MEQEPTVQEVRDAIRRACIALKATPVFMGSAYKNKGVQLLLDGVNMYLPNPKEVQNVAADWMVIPRSRSSSIESIFAPTPSLPFTS